jgi:hypothetical protein
VARILCPSLGRDILGQIKASYIANTHQISCQNVSKLFSSTRGIYQKFIAAGWELANEQPRHIRSFLSFYPSIINLMSG